VDITETDEAVYEAASLVPLIGDGNFDINELVKRIEDLKHTEEI